MQNQYHIDLTPEEDALFREVPEQTPIEKKINFNIMKNKVFWIVVSIHVGILAILTVSAAPQKDKPVPENIIAEDKTFVKENKVEPLSTPEPTPFPTPQFKEPIDGRPEPTPQPVKHTQKENKKNISKSSFVNNLTKNYTIKNGDTVFSIAKKYKLDYDRLIKINGIKDPNKIKAGQTLKFM